MVNFAVIMREKGEFWFHIAAILMVTVWGVSFINTKVLLDNGLTPTEIFVLRFGLAFAGLIVINRFRMPWCNLKDEALFLICGLMGGTAYFILENTALLMTLISDVAIIVSTAPILTALLVIMVYKDEHFNWVMGAGSVMAMVGVTVLTLRNGLAWGNSVQGDLLAFTAAFTWGVYCLALKKLNRVYGTLLITEKTFFYGLLTALPLLLTEDSRIELATLSKTAVWANLLYLGLICSMAAFFIWGRTVKAIGAVRASNYIYLSPAISMTAAALWDGENVGALGYVGCVLIFTGMVVVEKADRITAGIPFNDRPAKNNH